MNKTAQCLISVILLAVLLVACTTTEIPATPILATNTVAPTATQPPTATPVPPTPTSTPLPTATISEDANLYEGPGNLDYPILTELPAGTTLTLEGIYGDFVQVTATLNGQTQVGFVYSKLLDQMPTNLPELPNEENYGKGEWWKLPLSFDQPLPKNLQAINLQNAPQIQLMAAYFGKNETQRYSIENNLLVTMNSEQVNVYSITTQEHIAQLDLGGSVALEIAKDGSVFVVSQGDVLHVFDAYGANIVSIRLKASTGTKDCIYAAVSPRGDLVAVSCGQSFEIFSIPSGEIVYTWDKKSLTLHGVSMRFSPDGKKIGANIESGIGVWSVGDWSKLGEFPGGSWYFTPDDPDLLLIRIMDQRWIPTNTFQVWKISERKMVKQVDVQPGQWNFILTSSNASPSGELVLPRVIDDGSVNYETSLFATSGMYPHPGRKEEAWSQLLAPRFEFVTRSEGAALFVSDNPRKNCWLDLNGQIECINDKTVILGSDKQIYISVPGTEDGLPKEDIKKYGQEGVVATISGAFYIIQPDSIDPASQLVFYTGFRDVNYSTPYIKNYRTNGIVKSWNENGALGFISYSKDGNYAAFFINQNGRENLVIFDLKNNVVAYQELFSLGSSQPRFSPDDAKLVYVTWPGRDAKPNYVEVMNVSPPRTKTRYTFDLEKGVYPFCATFSPDGSMLAVGFVDGAIRLVNLADGTVVHEWQAHHEFVTAMAFSDDGTLLASSGRSGIVKFWGILDQ